MTGPFLYCCTAAVLMDRAQIFVTALESEVVTLSLSLGK